MKKKIKVILPTTMYHHHGGETSIRIHFYEKLSFFFLQLTKKRLMFNEDMEHVILTKVL